jgi:hypothetical protein
MSKCLPVLLLIAAWPLCTEAPAQMRTSRRGAGQQTGISPLETPAATFHGTLKSVSKKELVLALPEEHEVAFYISHKTKFLKDEKPIKPSEIPAGAPLSVDGKRDVRGNTEAVTVRVESPKAESPKT